MFPQSNSPSLAERVVAKRLGLQERAVAKHQSAASRQQRPPFKQWKPTRELTFKSLLFLCSFHVGSEREKGDRERERGKNNDFQKFTFAMFLSLLSRDKNSFPKACFFSATFILKNP